MTADPAETVHIVVDEPELSFESARSSADKRAAERMEDPLLLAWYDGLSGRGHPDVHECHDKPGWVAYAENRGGTLTVKVNGAKYIFMYCDASLTGT